jgi:hypothetical protein
MPALLIADAMPPNIQTALAFSPANVDVDVCAGGRMRKKVARIANNVDNRSAHVNDSRAIVEGTFKPRLDRPERLLCVRARKQMQDQAAGKLAHQGELNPGVLSCRVNAEHARKPARRPGANVLAVQLGEEARFCRGRLG